MKTYPPIPSRSWIWTSLLLIMFASVFERALDSVDKWLSTQGPIAFLALFLTPIALILAGSTAGTSFMSKFGAGVGNRKRLGPIYAGTLFVWMILSMTIRVAISGANIFSSANFGGFLIIAATIFFQTLLGCGFVWAEVVWFGRKLERRSFSSYSAKGAS